MRKLRYVKVDLKNLDIAFQIQAAEWPDEKDYEGFVEMAECGDDKNVNFIVYLLDEPIGITGVYTEDIDDNSMWLNWFCVVEKYRGYGFGKRILLDTINYCKRFDDVDFLRVDTEFNLNRISSNLYFDVMDFIEKYTAEDEGVCFSGNYICSKRLKDNINFVPWNNKNLHLKEYYKKDKK